jgi:hypothetical protein
MNYTYLESSPFSPQRPVIVMTTNPASKKMINLVANPRVSLLVHDWVSHRPATNNSATAARRLSGGDSDSRGRSSLAELLLGLNSAAVSSISATINGDARLVESDTDEERWYKARHLENNTFDATGGASAAAELRRESVVPGTEEGRYVTGEDVRVVVVGIRDVRISDWKGAVRDWVLVPSQEGEGVTVNGIS